MNYPDRDNSYTNAGAELYGVYAHKDLDSNNLHRFSQEWAEKVQAKIYRGSEILFLGCGNGTADFSVAQMIDCKHNNTYRAFFLDTQREVIAEQIRRQYEGHKNCDFSRTMYGEGMPFFARWDLNANEYLPFKNEALSGIYFRWAMHWVHNPFFLMREFSRVLESGAYAYIAVATPWSLTVMNERFAQDVHTLEELTIRYPQADIQVEYDNLEGKNVWAVSHAQEIEDWFSKYPHLTFCQREKAPDSLSGWKRVTGFLPGYFESTARSFEFDIVGLETEINYPFTNLYDPKDPRSQTGLQVLLKKK